MKYEKKCSVKSLEIWLIFKIVVYDVLENLGNVMLFMIF